jgi:hypothetical protein
VQDKKTQEQSMSALKLLLVAAISVIAYISYSLVARYELVDTRFIGTSSFIDKSGFIDTKGTGGESVSRSPFRHTPTRARINPQPVSDENDDSFIISDENLALSSDEFSNEAFLNEGFLSEDFLSQELHEDERLFDLPKGTLSTNDTIAAFDDLGENINLSLDTHTLSAIKDLCEEDMQKHGQQQRYLKNPMPELFVQFEPEKRILVSGDFELDESKPLKGINAITSAITSAEINIEFRLD